MTAAIAPPAERPAMVECMRPEPGNPDSVHAIEGIATSVRGMGENLASISRAAANTVGATLEEAALTTKIKAKMALDDMVKATFQVGYRFRGHVIRPAQVQEGRAQAAKARPRIDRGDAGRRREGHDPDVRRDEVRDGGIRTAEQHVLRGAFQVVVVDQVRPRPVPPGDGL